MFIVACDFHSLLQQIAMLDRRAGEVTERRLVYENGEADGFCATLPGPARVEMEPATYAQWEAK